MTRMDRLQHAIQSIDREIDDLRVEYFEALQRYHKRRETLVQMLATSGRLVEDDIPHNILEEVMVDG